METDELWKAVKGYEVRFLKPGKMKYGRLNVTLHRPGDKQKTFQISRLVGLAFVDNPENLNTVDHINHDVEDNRVENLRWTNDSQQQQNTRKGSRNTSGIKGISWAKREKRWRAQLNHNGKLYSRYFLDKNDAIAYLKDLVDALGIGEFYFNEAFGNQ
jgi:hypothetical protein